MPVAASVTWECPKVVIGTVGFFIEYFFDSFFGCTLGAKDDFTRYTAPPKFVPDGGGMTFVVHKS